MQYLWIIICLSSIAYAFASGQTLAVTAAVLQAGVDAFQLTLTMGGSMMLWCGLMNLLQQTGDVERLAKMLRWMLRPLFRGITDQTVWSSIGLNLSANMLGLGNAATPAGIQAAKELTTQGSTGRRALALLLVINNSSVQLLPTTVINLRSAYGAASPADIWLPTLVTSLFTTIVSVMIFALLPTPREGW